MICRNLPFYEFRPGIFEVDEFDCVSCFVVVGEKSALLLDVGRHVVHAETAHLLARDGRKGVPDAGI